MKHFVTWKAVMIIFCLCCSRIMTQECASSNDFLCRNGDCISKEFLCDGSKECVDGSDETNDLCQYRSCSQSIDYVDRSEDDIFAIPTLGSGKSFRCGYGACISNQFVCDGIRHCVADGSDEAEELCSKLSCRESQFRCNYGGCIMRRQACDNRYHCYDQSDETTEACAWRRRQCASKRHFICAYGSCIQKSKKCNGKVDCLDGSDESISSCGPRPHNQPEPVSRPVMPHIHPTTPPPTIKPIPEFLVNNPHPVISFQPPVVDPSSPANKPPSFPEGSGKGCELTNDHEGSIDIIVCGDSSGCFENILPAGTVMTISCDGMQTPLQCKKDDLWHFVRDPSKAPRKKPCEDAGSSSIPIDTRNKHRIHTPVPTNCGNLSPFTPIPWLVGLFRNGNFSCTGTLIGPALVLTAGHCITSNQATNTRVMSPDHLKIQFLSKQPNDPRDFAAVSAIELHPNYIGGDSPRFDIALLFLTKNLAETHDLSSACLDDEGKLLLVPAWTFNRTVGQTVFQWDNFQQIFDRSCVNKATICTRHLNIGDNQFCAINEEDPRYLHQGASGGPYLIMKTQNGQDRWTVAGVVSSSIQTTECGTRTVFTYVSNLRNWIINCGFSDNCKG